jgi:hypothetical protein
VKHGREQEIDLKEKGSFTNEQHWDVPLFHFSVTTEPWSWDSAVSLWTGQPRGQNLSPCRVKKFHFSMSSRLALGFIQPDIQWIPGEQSS